MQHTGMGEVDSYLGHSVNQSMVQQLTREGNIRHLERKESPTGLMHITICNLSCTRLMKWLKMASLEGEWSHV